MLKLSLSFRLGLSLNLLVGITLSLLLGCSAPGRSYTESTMQETLETEIVANNSKMFVYRLRWPEDSIPSLVHVERGANNQDVKSGGVQVVRSTQDRLRENAAYVVKHMGYCREGFLEIDSNTSRYHLWLKGECKEDASDADRKQFGEKQTLPVRFPR